MCIRDRFWLTQEAIPLLPKGASIITTSSIQAYQPSPHLLDYAATKAAILNYSRGLAKQVAEKGIRVNIVAPGPIWTALQISGGQTQDKIPQFGQKTPMKRAGQPAELAPVYVLSLIHISLRWLMRYKAVRRFMSGSPLTRQSGRKKWSSYCASGKFRC